MIIDWTRDTTFQGLIWDWSSWSYVTPRKGHFVSEDTHRRLTSQDGIKFASEDSGKMVSEVGGKLITEE